MSSLLPVSNVQTQVLDLDARLWLPSLKLQVVDDPLAVSARGWALETLVVSLDIVPLHVNLGADMLPTLVLVLLGGSRRKDFHGFLGLHRGRTR